MTLMESPCGAIFYSLPDTCIRLQVMGQIEDNMKTAEMLEKTAAVLKYNSFVTRLGKALPILREFLFLRVDPPQQHEHWLLRVTKVSCAVDPSVAGAARRVRDFVLTEVTNSFGVECTRYDVRLG
jgi:hypothetical protein